MHCFICATDSLLHKSPRLVGARPDISRATKGFSWALDRLYRYRAIRKYKQFRRPSVVSFRPAGRSAGPGKPPAAYATRMKALEQEVRALLHAAQQ